MTPSPSAPAISSSAKLSPPAAAASSSLNTVLKTCLKPGAVLGLSVSEHVIAASIAGVVTLFDARTGKPDRELDLGPPFAFRPSFSPDGTKLSVSTFGPEAPYARVEWFDLEAVSKRSGVDVQATAESWWSSNGQLLYVDEGYGWRVVDTTRSTTVAQRRFTGGRVNFTHAGLFFHTHQEWKQTVSPLDGSLRERTTWIMPDGDGEVLGAVDAETIIFANRKPDANLEAPVEVALFSNGKQGKILGTLPGAHHSVARLPDGALLVLATSMMVDGPGGDGVWIVDPKRERIDHHRAAEDALWPPIAVSPNGQIVFAFTVHPDAGTCIVGVQLPSRNP